jgi:ferric-dicitrate binding protein FerR (iron transport regulator)
MTHPDLDRLTSLVHGFLETGEADATRDHVDGCPECRDAVESLHEEARLLAREILPPARMAALKEGILQAAGRRRARGLLWQIPVAAAVLLGLIGVLLSPGTKHGLTDGRVSLPDGRVVAAPMDLSASESWRLQALEKSQVRLSDHSIVELGAGTRISLLPGGTRGVQADVSAGEAVFSVAPDPKRLTILSPAGRVEATDGRFSMRIVFEEQGDAAMNKALAGAIVTVIAGSVSLSNPSGTAEARPGQSAVLAAGEAPLFLASPQDKQEDLLRRLEQLAARVAKLEDEVVQLEAKNKQLKTQLQSNAPGMPGGAIWSANGAQGVKVIHAGGGAAPGSVIIELKEGDEKKADPKSNPR